MGERFIRWQEWSRQRTEGLLFLTLLLLSFLIFWQLGIDRLLLSPDRSMQVYIAQEMLRGHPPYLAVIFPKTPLTAMLSALAIFVGNIFGIMDLISVRLLFLALGSLGVALTFLVAKSLTTDLWPRLAAALVLMGFGLWASSSAAGPEPKILVMVCGLASLWGLIEKRWFLAGFFASLAFLTWQPGGIFLALALLMPLADKSSRRGKSLLSALAGGILPLAIVVLYLSATGAILPALRQAFFSQLLFLMRRQGLLAGGWSLEQTISRLLHGGTRILAPELGLVVLGALGFVGFSLRALFTWRRAKTQGESNLRPLLISGWGWAFFSLLDIQGAPDLIPLLPYLSLGVGWIVVWGVQILHQAEQRWFVRAKNWVLSSAAILSIMVVLTANALKDFRSQNGEVPLLNLEEQMRQTKELEALLGTEARVQAIGDLIILVLSEKENLTPLIHLGPKHYNTVQSEPGGLEKILKEIEERAPQAMIIDNRNWNRPWTQPFIQLVEDSQIFLWRPDSLLPAEGISLSLNLGDYFRLLGYRIPSPLRPGEDWRISLFWLSRRETSGDYHVFLHLVNSQGNILAQSDAVPTKLLVEENDQLVETIYPTYLWAPGEIVRDVHFLTIPAGLPPGEYRLRLGMYSFPTLERLPILEENGVRLANDELIISGIRGE